MLGKTDDGREFPQYNGQLLPWAISITLQDEEEGYPRLRTVIRAMREHRPAQLERERIEMLKGSFDRVFGSNAKKVLNVIEQEIRS
jgi:hypothetical protein